MRKQESGTEVIGENGVAQRVIGLRGGILKDDLLEELQLDPDDLVGESCTKCDVGHFIETRGSNRVFWSNDDVIVKIPAALIILVCDRCGAGVFDVELADKLIDLAKKQLRKVIDDEEAYQKTLNDLEWCHCGFGYFHECRNCDYKIGNHEIRAFNSYEVGCDPRFAYHWLRHDGWKLGRRKRATRDGASIHMPNRDRRYDLHDVARADGVSVDEIKKRIVDWIEKDWSEWRDP